jgi:GDPmannose 4,6-dehydratase
MTTKLTNKIALITGVTGQDGSYLSELLISKSEYNLIIGLYRRTSSSVSMGRIGHLYNNPKFLLLEADLTDYSSINNILHKYAPDEIYNLAAQSHVQTSFDQPFLTFQVNTMGVLNLLESIRQNNLDTKIYQASTSEMFGEQFNITENQSELGTFSPSTIGYMKYQNETTPLIPRSPYGASKIAAHHLMRNYRESYNIFASCGILFNHESPRRGANFVTKKITSYIGKLESGLVKDKLKLGNIDSCRDWGHAKDYVRAMWMMLQHPKPIDFVISTKQTHSVKEFLAKSFSMVNKNYEDYIEIDPSLYRPAEVSYLLGDNRHAQTVLGWSPSISFDELVKDMVDYDVNYYKAKIKK